MNKKRALATILIIIAILIIPLNINITGAVVGTSQSNFLSLITIVFLIAGIWLLMAGKTLELVTENETGEINISHSKTFSRGVKCQDKNLINRALKKIGTGKGKEHRLKTKEPTYSISTTGGGRILFEQNNPNEVTTIAYLSSHNYDTYIKNKS